MKKTLLVKQIKLEAANAFPFANRGERYRSIGGKLPRDQTLPLVGWMSGVRSSADSKIFSVCKNGHWPYQTYSAITHIVTERLAKKHKITSVQASFLYDFLSTFYRGNARNPHYFRGLVDSETVDDIPKNRRLFFEQCDFFRDCLSKAGITGKPPLRVLLSPAITAILLINKLEKTL